MPYDLPRIQPATVARRSTRRLAARWPALGVPAFFALLTVCMTWPLAPSAGSAVIGWAGDNFYFVWLIGWVQQALFVLHRSPLFVPSLNYPAGWPLAYNEITPAMVGIALPFSLVGGPTLGYNIALLASFVLSGVGMYVWVRRLSGSAAAGLIAGTIFAFAPYRMSHLFGHFNLMGTQWFPFYFMSLDRAVQAAAPAWRHAAAAGICLGLIGLTSQYYLYMTLVISGVYIASSLWLFNRAALRDVRLWRSGGALLAAALPLILLSIVPYARVAVQASLYRRSFDEVRGWSASPTDFLLPSPGHAVWGDWIRQHFDRTLWIENTLYLGVVTMVLAALALIRRRQTARGGRVAVLLAASGFSAFLLALGTDLHWFGRVVTVEVPAFVQRFHPYPQTFIPLPGYALFKLLPFYAGMRVWMRYGVYVMLFASALAGLGSGWLIGRLRRQLVVPVTAGLIALVLIDFSPGPLPLATVQGRAVDAWLAAQPAEGAVAQFPVAQMASPQQTYYTLIHARPFVGGFFAAYTPPQFARIRPLLETFPDAGSIAVLRGLGVRYVLVDARAYQDFAALHAAITAAGLPLATSIDGQFVYLVQ